MSSPKGVSQMFPGYKWRTVPLDQPTMCKVGDVLKDCPGFDPRTRGWFMGTASTSKSIVIILDVSSSMGDFNRIENAIYATRTVINFLTERDYVGIVMFNAEAFRCRRQSDVLLQATPYNKKILIDCIENMMPFGSTNFEAAFSQAFDLLDSSNSTFNETCEKVILFLTDGTITMGENPIPLIRERNAEHKAKIFSFSLGSDADTEIPKKIACEHRGLWSVIADKRILDLNSQMSSYYEYLSARYEGREATWSKPFVDVTGMGEVATVSISCSTSEGKFLGVALAAVLSSSLKNSSEYYRRTNNFKCPKTIPDEYLQKLRIEEGKSCNYCGYCREGDSLIIGSSVGVTVSLVLILLLVCLIWGCRKLFIRRKWKTRKNKISSNFRHSHSWADMTSSKRKLEKVRLPVMVAGEELELNQEYSIL